MASPIALGSEPRGIQTLTESAKRAFIFLNALGTQIPLREHMNEHGYTQDDHREGWRLVLQASGSEVDPSKRPRTAAGDAVIALDQWDELGFHKAHAALARRFPEQAEFVFKDLAPSQGPTAILGIVKFLDRVDVLESGSRTATADADKKAVEALTARGITPDERARLRALVAIVQAEPTAPLPGATPEGVHIDNLAALYGWYAEWSEIAHAVIARRADLIKLGIAKPRKRRTSPMPIAAQTGTEPSTGTGFGAAPVVAVTTPAPVTNGMSNASNGALATPNVSPSVSVA